MSRTRELIISDTLQESLGVNSVENSTLKTTERLLIQEGIAIPPSKIIGDIVWNMALIFEDENINEIYSEVTCTTDGVNIIFSDEDLAEINNKYCIITYLTEKVI